MKKSTTNATPNATQTDSAPQSAAPQNPVNPPGDGAAPAEVKVRKARGPISEAHRKAMLAGRAAAKAENDELTAALLSDKAGEAEAWEKFGQKFPDRLLAIAKNVAAARENALKARVIAAREEAERVAKEAAEAGISL